MRNVWLIWKDHVLQSHLFSDPATASHTNDGARNLTGFDAIRKTTLLEMRVLQAAIKQRTQRAVKGLIL